MALGRNKPQHRASSHSIVRKRGISVAPQMCDLRIPKIPYNNSWLAHLRQGITSDSFRGSTNLQRQRPAWRRSAESLARAKNIRSFCWANLCGQLRALQLRFCNKARHIALEVSHICSSEPAPGPPTHTAQHANMRVEGQGTTAPCSVIEWRDTSMCISPWTLGASSLSLKPAPATL